MDLAEHHDDVQGPIQLPVPTTVEARRTTWPKDTSTGTAPASIAKAASERNRPGWDQLSGPAQRAHGGPVLHRIAGHGHQPGAGTNLLAPGPAP